MEENFDSELKETKIKMIIKSVGQKNTNRHFILKMNDNRCNTLLVSNITQHEIYEENSAVNKMLLMLIFLMVK